jgi:hypothetical protein
MSELKVTEPGDGELAHYEAARRSLAKAHRIDEVTAAHHSWYYTMLEFAKKLKGKEKAAYLKQAAAVSAEQKRRRRNLERRILRSEEQSRVMVVHA